MMKKKKDKRQRIPLGKYTRGGRAASVMAVISALIFFVAVAISISMRGNAGIIVGVLGFLTFVMAVAGFIVGLLSFREETKFFKYSWIGTISNLMLWLMMFQMFLIYR